MDLEFPTIHNNGTSAEGLKEEWSKAYLALDTAAAKIRECAPNKRDYYVKENGDRAFSKAIDQHMSRLKRIRDIQQELEYLCEQVDKQST